MRVFFAWFLLAWILGLALGVAGRSPQTEQVCVFTDDVTGTIVEPVLIEADRIQVVVEDDKGCRALIYADRFLEVSEGAVVAVFGGSIKSLAETREFSPGYADYLERKGIGATWLYPTLEILPNLPPPAGGLRGSKIRQDLHEGFRVRVNKVFTEPEASLVKAMLLADRGTLPENIVQSFRGTGVSHVLAISGLHISLLTGMLLGILLLLPLSPWIRTALLLLLLWGYVVFIGAPTSAIRAAAFWTMALMALRLHLLISLPTVILLATAILVSLEPEFLQDVGFQLSISAVTGIWLALFLATTPSPRHSPGDSPLLRGRNIKWLKNPLLVSLGASLATGPLVAYHFGNIALSSVLTNLLVVPVVPALLWLAIIAILISFVFMPAALLIAYLVHLLFAWINMVTSAISSIPYIFWEEVAVPIWVMFVYYGAFVFLAILILKKQGRTWREVWG